MRIHWYNEIILDPKHYNMMNFLNYGIFWHRLKNNKQSWFFMIGSMEVKQFSGVCLFSKLLFKKIVKMRSNLESRIQSKDALQVNHEGKNADLQIKVYYRSPFNSLTCWIITNFLKKSWKREFLLLACMQVASAVHKIAKVR